jgi:hypothetical protein
LQESANADREAVVNPLAEGHFKEDALVLSLFFDNLSSSLVMDVADFEGDLRAKPWATTSVRLPWRRWHSQTA